MAWLSSNSFTPTAMVSHTMFNNLANDIRNWGGDVNGGGYRLVNVQRDFGWLHVLGSNPNNIGEIARFQATSDSVPVRSFITIYTTDPLNWTELSVEDVAGLGPGNGLSVKMRNGADPANRVVHFGANGKVYIGPINGVDSGETLQVTGSASFVDGTYGSITLAPGMSSQQSKIVMAGGSQAGMLIQHTKTDGYATLQMVGGACDYRLFSNNPIAGEFAIFQYSSATYPFRITAGQQFLLGHPTAGSGNGVDRLQVNGSAIFTNIGVSGQSSNLYKVMIQNTTSFPEIYLLNSGADQQHASGSWCGVRVNNSTSSGSPGFAAFTPTAGGGMWMGSAAYAYTFAQNSMLFATNAANGFVFATSWSSEKMRITGTGVGIGNSTPAVLLDIMGPNVSGAGQLRISSTDFPQITFYNSSALAINAANRKAAISYDLNASTLTIQNFNGGTFGPLLLNPVGGNVGVNNSAPAYALDVTGDLRVTGNIYGVNLAGQTPWRQNIDAAGYSLTGVSSLAVTGLITAGSVGLAMAVRPVISFTTTGQTAKARVLQAVAGSRMDVNSNLSFDGTNWNHDDIALASASYTQNAGSHYFNTIPAGANPATSAMITVLTLSAAGKAGINQLNPAYACDVTGDVNVTGTFRVNGVAINTGLGGGQTPWTSDIQGATYKLINAGSIDQGLPAITTTIGNKQSAIMSRGSSSNAEFFETYYFRKDAAAGWNGVVWRQQRTVDATKMTYVEHGAQRLAFGVMDAEVGYFSALGLYGIADLGVSKINSVPVSNSNGAFVIYNNTNSQADWGGCAFQIRENKSVSNTVTALTHAPRMVFHWGSNTVVMIGMNYSGEFTVWGYDTASLGSMRVGWINGFGIMGPDVVPTANQIIHLDSGGNLNCSSSSFWAIGGNFSGNVNAASFNGLTMSAGGAPGANQILRSNVNGYSYFGYINSSTGLENPPIAYFIVENTSVDGFYRKANVAHVSTYITPTWANVAAKPAWNSAHATAISLAWFMPWKNFGANHVIFDASNSIAPDGSAVNRDNAAVAWSGTYPCLMGWNGISTYGVRVDHSRYSDSTYSAAVCTGNAATATTATNVAWSGVTSKPANVVPDGSGMYTFWNPVQVLETWPGAAIIIRESMQADGRSNASYPRITLYWPTYGACSIGMDITTGGVQFKQWDGVTPCALSAGNLTASTFNGLAMQPDVAYPTANQVLRMASNSVCYLTNVYINGQITASAGMSATSYNGMVFAPDGGVNGGNQIVHSSGDGHVRMLSYYLFCSIINTNIGVENPAIANFYVDNGDGYIRKGSLAHVKASLGVPSGTFMTAGALNVGPFPAAGFGPIYSQAALEIREANFAGGAGTGAPYYPRIGFHHAGMVASSIAMNDSGAICIMNNPGTGYEAFICANQRIEGNLFITGASVTMQALPTGAPNIYGRIWRDAGNFLRFDVVTAADEGQGQPLMQLAPRKSEAGGLIAEEALGDMKDGEVAVYVKDSKIFFTSRIGGVLRKRSLALDVDEPISAPVLM